MSAGLTRERRTKIGRVSFWCSIGDNQHVLHNPEFAEDAGSGAGDRAVLLAAKVMAMTAVDILTIPGCVERITEAFTRYREGGFRNVPGIPPGFRPIPHGRLMEVMASQGQGP